MDFKKQQIAFLMAVAVLCVVSDRAFGQTAPAAQNASSSDTNSSSSAAAALKDALQAQIQQKTQELQAINSQVQETQKNLAETQSQRLTLQKQLNIYQSAINQLNLNIKEDSLSVQKLNLEVDSLNYDLKDIQSSMDDKKAAINKLLVELQKTDVENSNLLAVFLKNKTLADGVLEAQSLSNIRNQLKLDIQNLASLSEEYNGKIKEKGGKISDIKFHQDTLAARKSIVNGQKEEQQVVLAQTQNQEALYQKQLEELKKQQDSVSDEIGQIEDQLRASFNISLLPVKRPGVLAWPVENHLVTQHYGEKSYLYRYKPHNGLDIGVSIGTPVFAADDGVIMAVGDNDVSRWRKYQYGKYVLIKHNNDLATLYAHLSKQIVQKGDTVKRGDLIGYSGSTGYATGPHLHFGLYWAPSIIMKSIPPAAGLVPVGVTINPEDYL